MNNDAITRFATDALAELIGDADENDYPLNDDDFADFAEILLIDDEIAHTDDDLQKITQTMIELCDAAHLAH